MLADRLMKIGSVATCFPFVCPPWASKALEQDEKAIIDLDMSLPLKITRRSWNSGALVSSAGPSASAAPHSRNHLSNGECYTSACISMSL